MILRYRLFLAATLTVVSLLFAWACVGPPAPALQTGLPHAVAEVVHVPPHAAPDGGDRYFKLHLDVDHLAADARHAQELQYYLHYHLRHDLWWSNGIDSLNPEVYFHEVTHGITGRESIYLGFPTEGIPDGRLRIGGMLAEHRTYDVDPRIPLLPVSL